MTLVPLFCVIAAALGVALGGSLQALAQTQFKYVSVLLGALAVQLYFIFGKPSVFGDYAVWVFALSQVSVAIFLVVNHSLPGMKLAALGFLLNVVVITANGAMPVSASAAAAVHDDVPPPEGAGYKHERLDDGTFLPWLGDVIPVQGVNTVLSIGDVFVAVGIGWLVFSRTRAVEPRGKHAVR